MTLQSRRAFLSLAAAAAVSATAGCATTGEETPEPQASARKPRMPFGPEPEFAPFEEMYAAMRDEEFALPAIPYSKIDPQFLRQVVRDPTGEKAGSIVVDTTGHHLYLVLGNGNAVRYGVGLGRAGFEWSGRATMQWKRKWPTWTPPAEMIERQPELEKYSEANGGQKPGLDNPLGARALYIFQDGIDTLYRLHGTPQWNSIGKSVSSGCVRLMNQDVIDLYSRVPNKSPILVR